MAGMKLVSLDAVFLTNEPDVYDCDITMMDEARIPEKVQFISRADDPYGLGPVVRKNLKARLEAGLNPKERPR